MAAIPNIFTTTDHSKATYNLYNDWLTDGLINWFTVTAARATKNNKHPDNECNMMGLLTKLIANERMITATYTTPGMIL